MNYKNKILYCGFINLIKFLSLLFLTYTIKKLIQHKFNILVLSYFKFNKFL